MDKQLFRIKNQDTKLGGVAMGLAEYFDIDISLVRAAFVILVFTPIPAITAYGILWVVLPEKATFEPSNSFSTTNYTTMQHKEKNNMVGGLILVALGLTFTMREFFDINLFGYIGDMFRFAGRMWPLFLIGLGVWLILKDRTNPPSSNTTFGDNQDVSQ